MITTLRCKKCGECIDVDFGNKPSIFKEVHKCREKNIKSFSYLGKYVIMGTVPGIVYALPDVHSNKEGKVITFSVSGETQARLPDDLNIISYPEFVKSVNLYHKEKAAEFIRLTCEARKMMK